MADRCYMTKYILFLKDINSVFNDLENPIQ
jgi:hypothetical protein